MCAIRSDSQGASRDQLMEALSDVQRREIITVLDSEGERLPRSDLAREVAARGTSGEPSAEAVDEVEVLLHHVHLPKLEQVGLVEYDVGSGTIASRDSLKSPNSGYTPELC